MKEKESVLGGAIVRRSEFLGSLVQAPTSQQCFLGVLTEIDSLPVIVFAPAKTVG